MYRTMQEGVGVAGVMDAKEELEKMGYSRESESESESRMDIIGQNGNDGEHYKELARVKPSEVLRAGAHHMEDRAATYDKPEGERSMAATVAAFKAITGVEMTEEQGWKFMAILKLVRSEQGDFKLDNYEDCAAYAALAAESASESRG